MYVCTFVNVAALMAALMAGGHPLGILGVALELPSMLSPSVGLYVPAAAGPGWALGLVGLIASHVARDAPR